MCVYSLKIIRFLKVPVVINVFLWFLIFKYKFSVLQATNKHLYHEYTTKNSDFLEIKHAFSLKNVYFEPQNRRNL